jgi:hypothetical protein
MPQHERFICPAHLLVGVRHFLRGERYFERLTSQKLQSLFSVGGRGKGARNSAPVAPERGRATRPLSFFFLALTLALAGVISSPTFNAGDGPEVSLHVQAAPTLPHDFDATSTARDTWLVKDEVKKVVCESKTRVQECRR